MAISLPHNTDRTISILCLGYFLVLVGLADKLSLWLDEILQLMGTRDQTLSEMVRHLATNPGATPLGNFVQAAFLNSFGYSLLWARLPSILCSTFACILVWMIARNIQPGARLLAVIVFMLLPFQFRYALEARPYSQALMFSAFSTVLFLELLKRFTVGKVVAYGIIVTLGLYSQPFSVFVPISHLLWATYQASRVTEWVPVRNALFIAIGLASLLLAPWSVYVRAGWNAAITQMALEGQGFHVTMRTPLMILREISGASYWGGVLLLIAGGIGVMSPALDRRKRALLCLLIAVPLLGAVIADALFDYFLAIRQMIFILPAVAVLAGEGLRYAYRNSRSVGVVLIAAFMAVTLWYDVGWFYRPREDWKSAAETLSAAAATSACILPVPSDALKLYTFFVPGLPKYLCASNLRTSRTAVLALSPYRSIADETAAYDWLATSGFRRKPDQATVGGVTIVRFERGTDN